MNIYYNPEKFGLTEVGQVEFSTGCYEFDTFAVWKDGAGKFYWAQDSGCSCPEPFGGLGLENIDSGTWVEMKAALDATRKERGDISYGATEAEIDADVVSLMEKATA